MWQKICLKRAKRGILYEAFFTHWPRFWFTHPNHTSVHIPAAGPCSFVKKELFTSGCIWERDHLGLWVLHMKKDAFPALCQSCSLMGEQDFTLVFVSLDLFLPLIFSLSLNLHLLSHFSPVLLSPQLDSLPKPQHYTDYSTSRMAAPGLVLLFWNGQTGKYFILLTSEIWLHVFPINTRLCLRVSFKICLIAFVHPGK